MKKISMLLLVLVAAALAVFAPCTTAHAAPRIAQPAWADPATYQNINFYNGTLNLSNKDWEGHAEILARLNTDYAGNYTDKNIRAAVAWSILNSFDSWQGTRTFEDVVKDFGYNSKVSFKDKSGNDNRAIARDVLIRWLAEKTGYTDVGRVIPANYTFLYTENDICHFRCNGLKDTKDEWNFSSKSPY